MSTTDTAAPPERADFRFAEPLRVRWSEVDLQGIVFNGHYLNYVDTAVAGWWRALGLPYAESMRALGGDLYVRRASLDYAASARYDERLEIGVRCLRVGRSSSVVQAAVFRDGQRLVHGELVYVFADPATQTARPVPDVLRALWQDFDCGARVLALAPAAGCAADDADDAQGAVDARRDDAVVAAPGTTRLSVVNRIGRAIGSVSLAAAVDGSAEVLALSIDERLRGAGLGTQALAALADHARRRGLRRLQLQVPRAALAWALRAGGVADAAGPCPTEAPGGPRWPVVVVL